METNTSGAAINSYIFFGGKRVARSNSSGINWYMTDHLGTSRVVWSTAGMDVSDFYPFGGERVISATAGGNNRYKFTGKERDSESGLDNFGVRYMSSWMGRFVSADPITVTPGRVVDPQQLNLYSYVRNNPLRLVDPTGMLIDDSQLSDKDKKKWQKIQDLANKKDKDGNYVNKKLHDVFDRLQSDKRTFTLENSKLGAGIAGKFKRIFGPGDTAQIDPALFHLRTRGDGDDAHAASAALRQSPALLFDEADDFGANSAESRNTHFQGCDHHAKNLPETLLLGLSGMI